MQHIPFQKKKKHEVCKKYAKLSKEKRIMRKNTETNKNKPLKTHTNKLHLNHLSKITATVTINPSGLMTYI